MAGDATGVQDAAWMCFVLFTEVTPSPASPEDEVEPVGVG